MNFFKIFRIVGMLSAWMEKAVLDGVIDQEEILDLVKTILDIAEVKVEISLD